MKGSRFQSGDAIALARGEGLVKGAGRSQGQGAGYIPWKERATVVLGYSGYRDQGLLKFGSDAGIS